MTTTTTQGTLFPITTDKPDTGYRATTAAHVTGITYRQLDYWARTGLVEPSARTAQGSGTSRLYTFRDLLVLRIIRGLLDTGISLPNIRRAVDTLAALGSEDLASITLFSDGTTVYQCRSPQDIIDLLDGGQGVFGIAVPRLLRDLASRLADTRAEPVAADPPVDELAIRRHRHLA